MVGADACITINWLGTADKLIELDPPVVSRFYNPVSDHVIDELMEKIPDFKRGYLESGITPPEYEDFGPVALFRDSFVSAWGKAPDAAVAPVLSTPDQVVGTPHSPSWLLSVVTL